MSLPDPDDDARARSAALVQRIGAAIDAAGGWIGFDAYMQRALYEPGLGYYSSATRQFGAAGDFVTAPELSPLFGECVAAQVAQWFDEVPARVVEFGAGTGALAAQLLAGLRRQGTPAGEYAIVELSADLRRRQRETLLRHAPEDLACVRWLDALPETIEGVVIGNELLDAMPVRLFEHDSVALAEVGVVRRGEGFGYAPRPADAAFAAEVDRAVRRAGAPWSEVGVAGLAEAAGGRYRSEVAPIAQGWVATVARLVARGALLLLDYGFPARELYHPQRSGGTLVCHYRHRVHDDPFLLPGLQDVTAHVDFSAVAATALAQGMDLLGYASQARFLMNCGVLDALARIDRDEGEATEPGAAGDGNGASIVSGTPIHAGESVESGAATLARARRVSAVQTLLSEAEMGELFKAIAFGRGISAPSLGFARGDRSASLAGAVE